MDRQLPIKRTRLRRHYPVGRRWTRTLMAAMAMLSSARCMVLPSARRSTRSHLDPLAGTDPLSTSSSWLFSSTPESLVSFRQHQSKLSTSSLIKPWQSLFDLELPEGRCVGIRLEMANQHPAHPDALSPEAIGQDHHWIHALLHPDEVQYAMSQPSETAQHSFFLGRLAMREAMLIPPDASILRDEHGRPTVPEGYLGSISHKRSTGVALVASKETSDTSAPTAGIGVDIEQTFSRRRSIAKRVLTERELGELGRIPGVTQDEEVLLRFSLKESLYKAMHPLICQYVGFHEAEVTPHADGSASVNWNLKTRAHERFDQITAHWRRLDDHQLFLSSASVTLRT